MFWESRDCDETALSSRVLSIYYLQQMGIESWVLRTNRSSCFSNRLLIVADGLDEQHRLLIKMLKSIDVSFEQVDILPFGEPDTFLERLKKTLECIPRAVLIMGEAAKVRQDINQVGIPVIATHHPTEFIQNPSYKKKAYHDLLQIKRLLAD